MSIQEYIRTHTCDTPPLTDTVVEEKGVWPFKRKAVRESLKYKDRGNLRWTCPVCKSEWFTIGTANSAWYVHKNNMKSEWKDIE